jgi:MoaA/NifB/PqqE/SkfB family radical SAM enzyme
MSLRECSGYTRSSLERVSWGGEPLLYRDWDGLVELLAEDPRWTAVCTNGTLIERRLDSLMKISRHLEVSVSLDGFETEHDSIRGKGSFQRPCKAFAAGRKEEGVRVPRRSHD